MTLTQGNQHIMIKAGAFIEIGEAVAEAGEIVDYVNRKHVLLEDICVFVENSTFKTQAVDNVL